MKTLVAESRKLRFVPILAGLLVNIVGTLLVSVPYVLVRFGRSAVRYGENDLPSGPTAADHALFTLLGLLVVLAAAFVAARIATDFPIGHGIVIGIIELGVSLWAMVRVGSDSPVWIVALSSVGMIGAGALGGYLAMRRIDRLGEATLPLAAEADDLASAYRLGVHRSRMAWAFTVAIGCFILVLFVMPAFIAGSMLGLGFPLIVVGALVMGWRAMRRDRHFRSIAPELHQRLSPWALRFHGDKTPLGVAFRRARREFWMTGRPPPWIDSPETTT